MDLVGITEYSFYLNIRKEINVVHTSTGRKFHLLNLLFADVFLRLSGTFLCNSLLFEPMLNIVNCLTIQEFA